ncbi:MAG: hypothetical protein II467_00905 [Bacilli bacterium]|nr:hypothetical protein [Bacilli bacterium]
MFFLNEEDKTMIDEMTDGMDFSASTFEEEPTGCNKGTCKDYCEGSCSGGCSGFTF